MVDREQGVKPFSYSDETLDELETALSRARPSTCLDAAGRDRERAIRLHAWNTAVGAAFYGPLQGLEVVLRNAMHRRLAECYGPAWYDHPGAGLDQGAVGRVAGARSKLARDGHRDAPTRIVATLSFGFRVSLLGPGGRTRDGNKANYEMTRWRPALRGAFVNRVKLNRRQAHHPLNALREEAGEHWTPRDAVRLMAKLVFLPVADEIESGTYLPYHGLAAPAAC